MRGRVGKTAPGLVHLKYVDNGGNCMDMYV